MNTTHPTKTAAFAFALPACALFLSMVCRGAEDANNSKYPGTETGARALLSEFLKPGADHKALSRLLQPSGADYESVFESPFAGKLESFYRSAWSSGQMVIAPKPGQTELILEGVSSADVRSWSQRADSILPGGYRSLAGDIKAGHTIYVFKFVAPGEQSGMAFDGLVYVNRHWCLFPKPWRAK